MSQLMAMQRHDRQRQNHQKLHFFQLQKAQSLARTFMASNSRDEPFRKSTLTLKSSKAVQKAILAEQY